ncbi:nucleolar protein 14 [Calycina marina]|uniref:Nucleolar protein 14 n=1 Tax=Calycina marina TaxID=1763456 RepID=A0A9P7Z320_9HELO|nr:nucleolar protein 14 [Calycina marina]
MPPSQLKRLKASLREQGIVGPQKSKKQKKQNAQNGVGKDKRVHRTEALNAIRDQFNPFEYKWSKGPKFEATTVQGSNATKGAVIGRSHVGKARAEDNDVSYFMAHKNKAGGIIDKRFGENDPTMDPEEKMLHRLTQVAERKNRRSLFDLDDDEPGQLTHMGQSLSLDGPTIRDDFDEADLQDDDEDTSDARTLKRVRTEEDGDLEVEEQEGMPERKKSKQEVMKEVIAKSKLHKYERQTAKEDDDDMRIELDKGLSGLHDLLRGIPSKTQLKVDDAGMDPERMALLLDEKAKTDKEYDLRLRQLALDARSKPTERTKTDEETAEDIARMFKDREAKRLKEQERQERKLRAMLDGDEDDAEEEDKGDDLDKIPDSNQENDIFADEEDNFGFGSGIQGPNVDIGVEDEDEFEIDDDLVAESVSGEEFSNDSGSEADEIKEEVEEDDDFVKDLLTEGESRRPAFLTGANAPLPEVVLPEKNGVDGNLAYTFECPQSKEDFLAVTNGTDILDLPMIIQRIRLQYDAKLKPENKPKLGKFAVALIDYISYLANRKIPAPMSVLENSIRHIHSLAKTGHALEIGTGFLCHLTDMSESRSRELNSGDLVLLTAIGSTFDTTDHFHDIVMPAMLTMDRYLSLKVPRDLSDFATGAYVTTLCLQYVQRSERYVPSVMNFIENSLSVLAPIPMSKLPGGFPCHEPRTAVRIQDSSATIRGLNFVDCRPQENMEAKELESLKLAVLNINLKLANAALNVWGKQPSTFEIFEPVLKILEHLESKKCRTALPKAIQTPITKFAEKLNVCLSLAQLSRRPLELHHHKPLAIKMAIPKFEESYNPNKHYDPDRERTENAKLQKELKREKKGAVRELRKDAKAIATENLRQKREKDAAYDKKYKRLIAEIQGEEGHEAKAYEREKEWRKKGKK